MNRIVAALTRESNNEPITRMKNYGRDGFARSHQNARERARKSKGKKKQVRILEA